MTGLGLCPPAELTRLSTVRTFICLHPFKVFCEAAESYSKKHEGKGKVKFFYVEGKSGVLSEEEAKKCDEGHSLAELERPHGWTCDRCSKNMTTPSSMGCQDCNFDTCPESIASRRASASPSMKLFSRLCDFLNQPVEVKASAVCVAGIDMSTKTWDEYNGKLSSADILAFAEAFVAKC